MTNFSLKGHLPVLEMKIMHGPMVFLKVGDRQLQLKKVWRVQGKFWESEDGVFELDGEYEYKLFGQAVYWFNLFNSKPISLSGIEQVQKLYKQRKFHLLLEPLEKIYNAVKNQKLGIYSPIHALKEISKAETGLPQEDEHFLVDYISYNKDDLKMQNIKEMTEKKLNKNISYNVKTIFPTLIFSGIGGLAVIMMLLVMPKILAMIRGG